MYVQKTTNIIYDKLNKLKKYYVTKNQISI